MKFKVIKVSSSILSTQEQWEETCWEEASGELCWAGSWCGHQDSEGHPEKEGTGFSLK